MMWSFSAVKLPPYIIPVSQCKGGAYKAYKILAIFGKAVKALSAGIRNTPEGLLSEKLIVVI